MSGVRVLGVDSGFCGTGLALVEWDGADARLLSVTTVATAPTARKLRLLVVDDHLRRIREIATGVGRALDLGRPDVVALEAFSPARNAGAAVRQAFGYAVAVQAAHLAGVPVAQFTPQAVRKALGLARGAAGKVGVESAVLQRLSVSDNGIKDPEPATEHEWDACAVALACLNPPADIVAAVLRARGGE